MNLTRYFRLWELVAQATGLGRGRDLEGGSPVRFPVGRAQRRSENVPSGQCCLPESRENQYQVINSILSTKKKKIQVVNFTQSIFLSDYVPRIGKYTFTNNNTNTSKTGPRRRLVTQHNGQRARAVKKKMVRLRGDTIFAPITRMLQDHHEKTS